ncbi:MAG: FHA domain-containing protein [Phototrophicaceae bacterium]
MAKKKKQFNNTTVLSKDNPLLRRAINQQSREDTDELTISEAREFLILIRGMVERVEIADGGMVTLGRFDLTTNPHEVDLTPYGAADRGVSREHAKIHMQGDNVYLTDLGSTNGTYLRGERLEPNEPVELQKGNEILFGRLAAQIMFR